MPLPKILAPLLPSHQQKHKDSPAVRDYVLSPVLPLSPTNKRIPVNENVDPIIGLATVDEDASAKSNESIMEESNSEKSPIANSENAMILHEKPTAFELCDNDLIIESVKEFQDDNENFDKDMMRDNKAYQGATVVDVTEEIQPAMVALPPSPPAASIEKEESVFIKPIQAEFIQDVFVSPKFEEQKQSHFAMESTFKRAKENSDFKSKCKKVLNGLVCKPEAHEDMDDMMKPTPAKFNNEPIPAGRGGPTSVNTKFVSAFDREEPKEEDPDMNTPIYHRRNTSGNSLSQCDDPIASYKSPALGTDAYNIKLLCDKSFFGRW